MTNKENGRRKGARHLRRGRPARGTAWLTEHSGQSGRGKHRYLRGPSSGLMAMSAVLLAASAASSSIQAGDTTPTEPERTRADADVSTGAGGNTPPRALFPRELVDPQLASGKVVNAAPMSFTGGIPSTVLAAYQRATERTNLIQPNCHIPLELLAAIGKVESGHARGGRVDAAGRTLHPILGPQLNGGAFAAIRDTDGGALDGDPSWDRAVGPMQFIPSTWARWAADGNVDGRTDPHNVFDASLAAARYLCAANRDLGTPQGLDSGILSYNHSTSYLSLVKSWMDVYRNGTISIGDITDPGVNPAPQAGVAPPAAPPAGTPGTPGAPPAGTPGTPPGTPPVPPPGTPPTNPPSAPPHNPPTTPPPTTPPPTTPPPTTPPPTTPPPGEPAPDCQTGSDGLLGGVVGGLLGGLLGSPSPEDPNCVQSLELATPETTATTATPTTTTP